MKRRHEHNSSKCIVKAQLNKFTETCVKLASNLLFETQMNITKANNYTSADKYLLKRTSL